MPLPWSGDAAPFGFGPGDEQPWIPQPDDWAALSVEAQTGDPTSTLEFYRDGARRATRRWWSRPGTTWATSAAAADVLSFARGPVTALVNCGTSPAPLPAGAVLVASGPLEDGLLPPDTAAWVRRD